MGDGSAKRGKHRYSRVSRRIWRDEKVRRLSGPQPNAQSLFVWLLTCTQQCIVPGLIAMGEAAIAEELGWPLEPFRESFRELLREGLMKADWDARLVWIPNRIYHDEPANPNVVKSWADDWNELPDCPLKSEAYEALRAYTEQRGNGFLNGFVNGCRNRLPNGMANQDQDQNQDQHQDQEQTNGPPAPAAADGGDVVSLPPRSELDKAASRVWLRFDELRRGRYPGARGLKLSAARRNMIRARLRDYGEERVLAALERFFDRRYFWGAADWAKRPELLFRSVDQFEKVEAARPLPPPTGLDAIAERRRKRLEAEAANVIDAEAVVKPHTSPEAIRAFFRPEGTHDA